MAKIPEQIDKYKIEKMVAAGGMGVVYKGIHPTLKRPIILKKLTLRGNPTITERFKREARILMDFRNDNIVDVQDHFVQGRSHYIVMEYIDGQSVKDLLDEQRYLDNFTTALIILETSKALKYAHSKGVIHRDIKPGNILISRKGEVKLADFGIASTRDPDTGEDTLTTDGTTLGTPAYMAPEQFENSRTVDHRADLYSLGVMMYEMLTGLKPFPGGFTPETIKRIQKGKYKKPRSVNPSINPKLQKIVNSLIKPKPKSRCGEVDKIINKLERWLGNFNETDVTDRLSAMICEKEIPPVRKKKHSKIRLYIAAGIIILTVAGLLTAYCSLTQLQKRLITPSEYGQIRIQTNSATRPVSSLFLDDDGDIPAIDTKVNFFPYKDRYRSFDIVLPAGKYRLKTMSGEKLIWTSFVLSPWSEKSETTVITPAAPLSEAREVNLSASYHDAETGRDLGSIAAIEIFIDGTFIPSNNVQIYSGEVHHFRISAPGYMSQEYILRIRNDESVLHFQAEMISENRK